MKDVDYSTIIRKREGKGFSLSLVTSGSRFPS
jgi:hypothetical protein